MSSEGLAREAFDETVSQALVDHGVDLVLLVGYMRILSDGFVDKWEGRLMNVHPSLLPDFAGGMDLKVHEAVLAAGKSESGCTVHQVTKEVDAGPIVLQKRCAVLKDDTPESLKARVQALEGTALIEAVQLYQRQRAVADGVEEESKGGDAGPQITYKDAGVDITAGNELVDDIKPLCRSTRRPGCDADLGGFGGMFDLAAAGFRGSGGGDAKDDPILVACTDGVGTKLKVAQIANKHDTVGVDLVAMCVNDLIVQGAEPLFFLDYFATGKLDKAVTRDVVDGIANGCRQSGCGLIGGETAEMPQMYADGEYDLGGFSVGAVQVRVHSNGFSLVRKVIEVQKLDYTAEAPFQAGVRLCDALLTPTKIYVKALMPAIRAGIVAAMAHITGGGLVEVQNLLARIDASSWSPAPVFGWLRETVPKDDMWRTFNCGIGMVVIVRPEHADEALRMFREAGEDDAVVIGRLEERPDGAEQVILE
eukprot:g667.t1